MSHAPERAYRSACNPESILHKCLGQLFGSQMLHTSFTHTYAHLLLAHIKKLNIVAIETGESMLYN